MIDIEWSKDIDSIPIGEVVLLLLSDGTIHTGIKKVGNYVKWPGEPREESGSYTYFDPVGVIATYSGEPYFEGDVVGCLWAVTS